MLMGFFLGWCLVGDPCPHPVGMASVRAYEACPRLWSAKKEALLGGNARYGDA